MLKGFSTKQLTFIALVAAAFFVFDLVFVAGVEALSGIPGSGAMIDSIFFVAVATVVMIALRRFGTLTLLAGIYGVLVIPTTIMGPPGVYKIPMAILLGLIADIILHLSKYKTYGYYLALTSANVLLIPVLYYVLIALGLPGADELGAAMLPIAGIMIVESLFGVWLGLKLHSKLKHKSFLKQVSA